jgi:mannose-6-phosphate isomerase-like protein (cupin superfamily)
MDGIVTRDWGYWDVLQKYDSTCKVKELVVNPGCRLSWQKHEHRSEHWFCSRGTATVYYSADNDGHEVFKDTITQGKWHQLANETEIPVHIIEIQFGSDCRESDIIRSERPPLNYQ